MASGLRVSDIVRATRDTDKIVTPTHERWLQKHGDDPYPDWVAEWVRKQLATKPRDRSKSFSASSAGRCPREQELQFLGMPQSGVVDPQLANIFDDGKWRHLRWQANMLTNGLLDRAEMPLFWRNKRSRGTIDGQGTVMDDHPRARWRGLTYGFELKGVSGFQYPKYVQTDEAKEEHLGQVHRYFLMGDFDLFVVVYEDKSTQAWHEWVIEPDDRLIDEQRAELDDLNHDIDDQELAPMLPECVKRRGLFKSCAFGGIGGSCVNSGTWPTPKKGSRK